MSKVGVILPYESEALRALLLDAARNCGFEPVFSAGYLGGAFSPLSAMLETDHVEAVIARNVTASLLRQRFDIPVINLEISSFSLFLGCHRLAPTCRIIGFFDFAEVPALFDTASIERVLGVTLRRIEVSRDDGDIDYLALLQQRGCDALATSSRAIYERCAGHIEAAFIEIGRAEAERAFQEARDSIKLRARTMIRTEFIKTTLDSVREGFVATDAKGRIAVLNQAMEQILGAPNESLLGMSKAAALAKYPFLQEIFCAADGALLTNGGTTYTVNRREKISGALSMREIISVMSVAGIQTLEQGLRRRLADRGFEARGTLGAIRSESECMAALKEKTLRYAATKSTILIQGESGTGKELFAQSIHNASSYRGGPFVAINCAALPDNLLESELFGYEEGAFTGARRGGKAGLMELSHGGSLFLDEIGELPTALQSKLLRSLQEKQICRVGGRKMIPVDMRVICASNRNLRQLTETGAFRHDLYYRINVLELTIPPLRERGEDIVLLARFFLSQKSGGMGKTVTLSDAMAQRLVSYSWPGNIRQLENFIERLVAMTGDGEVPWSVYTPLFCELTQRQADSEPGSDEQYFFVRSDTLDRMERQIIEEVSRRRGGKTNEICKELGISRSTLWRRTQQAGAQPPEPTF